MTSGAESPWPLIGRGDELSLIEETLHSRTDSVVIAGEAGVGKTRLASEVAAHWQATRVIRVAASKSLRDVPLGAFAAWLPELPGTIPRQPAESLHWLADSLATPGDPAPLLWVDDAHWLDPLGAGLVLQLAASGRARILASVRSGEPCPDALRQLWRDGLARRIELQPLGADDVTELLTRALGKPLDGVTRQRIGNASRGNLLYLRELVRIGIGSGALALRGDLWIWEGPLRVSPALQDLLSERLAGLDSRAIAALEAIAVAEPLNPAVAEQLGLADQLVDLERAGLLQSDGPADGATLRLAHPLFGEVLRAGLSRLRAAELERAHGSALAATGGDILRLAIAQAAGHLPADPKLLLEASVRARGLADHPLATRLAEAAVAAGGGPRAIVASAECLFWEQRYAEVLQLLDAHPIEERDCDARIIALHNRASALYWGFGRAEEAIEALLLAESIAPASPFARQATGQRAVLLSNHARPCEAIALSRQLLDDPHSGAPAKAYAFSALTLALAQTGRFEEALAEAQRGLPLVDETRQELPAAGDGIIVGAVVAWFLSGDFETLESVVGQLYRASAERSDPFLGLWAHFLARGDLARGHLDHADRHATEAVTLLRRRDPGLVLPWALAVLTQVAAQRGQAERATALARELAAQPCHMASYDAEIATALAWADVAAGDRAAARRRLAAIAQQQLAAGLLGQAAFAAHECARVGAVHEARKLVDEMYGRVDGALPAAWTQQVRALADRDTAALERAAAQLAAAGAQLDAAEADAAAAALHREAGHRHPAQRAASRSQQRAAGCGAPFTPALAALRSDARAALTPRELHIARLASSGRTRREIAGELALSTRTVGNHLNHIYAKLAVADRTSLAACVGQGFESTGTIREETTS